MEANLRWNEEAAHPPDTVFPRWRTREVFELRQVCPSDSTDGKPRQKIKERYSDITLQRNGRENLRKAMQVHRQLSQYSFGIIFWGYFLFLMLFKKIVDDEFCYHQCICYFSQLKEEPVMLEQDKRHLWTNGWRHTHRRGCRDEGRTGLLGHLVAIRSAPPLSRAKYTKTKGPQGI